MGILATTYKDLILNTKRGNNHGIFSNAKPIFVLSLIDSISEGFIVGNQIEFTNNNLQELYHKTYVSCQNYGTEIYRVKTNVTPFCMPFFHLNAEEYYHIQWKDGIVPPKQAHSPSAKYFRENVLYSYLDNELWNLLQAPSVRLEYKEAIIDKFIIVK